jgi:hypothetical protein
MPEHIGNAGNTATALVERIMRSLVTPNEPDIEPGGYDGEPELSYLGATQGMNQIQSRESVQRRFASQYPKPVPAIETRTNSASDIILPAPAVTMPLAARPRRGRNEVRASETTTAESSAEERPGSGPQIDAGEIADRVYRLMRHDLILGKELPDWGNKPW